MKRPFDSDSVCAVVYFLFDCILVWRVNSAGPDTVLKTVGTLVVWESSSPPSATIQFDFTWGCGPVVDDASFASWNSTHGFESRQPSFNIKD